MTAYSATELAALATKAARGAGLPPEQAARYGHAAVTHLAANRTPDELLKALETDIGLTLPRQTDACLLAPQRLPDTALAKSYVETLPFPASYSTPALTVTLDTKAPRAPKTPARIAAPNSLTEHWQKLAALTYVPETEGSRLSGAGAGLTDND